jgi:hypothetical protein
MEATLGISLYSYLCLKLVKALYLSDLLCFLFNKIGEQEGRTGSAQKGRGSARAGGEKSWPKPCMHMQINVKSIK